MAWVQTAYWRNSETLFERALAVTAANPVAEHNLGSYLLGVPGRLPVAIAQYQKALRLQPDYTDARNNLAAAMRSRQQAEAIAQFEAALRLRPDYAEAHNNLGVALTQIPTRASEALAHFQAAVKLNPDYADARVNLGVALSQMPGHMADAIAELEAAYRLHPGPELRRTLETLRTGK